MRLLLDNNPLLWVTPPPPDPFDRVVVVEAQLEGLTLVTRDQAFDAYDVAVLRC